MNGHNYMRWDTLLARVDPDKRYRVAYSHTGYADTGRNILDHAWRAVHHGSCTMIKSVREVPPEYVLPVKDLWDVQRDPATGRTIVSGDDQVWDITRFTQKTNLQLTPEEEGQLRQAADSICQMRLDQLGYDDPEITGLTLPVAENALLQMEETMRAQGRDWSQNATVAVMRVYEATDRAYGRERMLRAGVNIDDHPEWNSYQAFFDLGLPPPTHRDMADYLIANLGDAPAQGAAPGQPDP